MAPDFKSYLATRISVEKQTVSYRNVARALKVHANAAKCMLYEFYEREKKKSAGSVYATYLISGTKIRHESDVEVTKDTKAQNEGISSSPPPFTSSMVDPSQHSENGGTAPDIPVKTVTLAREEVLDSIRKSYETISSIHIYSISPGRLPDLVSLTDIGRELFTTCFDKEDPLKDGKIYGVIQNPNVQRRKGKRPTIQDTPAPKSIAMKNVKQETTKETNTNTAEAGPLGQEPKKKESAPSSRDSSVVPQATKPKPSLKKDNSSLFKAFAKQQDKPKLKRQDTDQSTNASASGAEDVKMTDAEEEGESDDEALFLDTNTRKSGSKKRSSEIQKERDDKNAKLRKMMEDDEEDEQTTAASEKNAEGKADVAEPASSQPHEVEGEVEWSESDTETKKSAPVQPTKRRGKRKVMKKRTMKDEDGYLVTKEEAVWESFSEDEPEPAKGKPKSTFDGTKSQSQSQKSAATTKGGDGSKKADIRGFFGKK